MPIIGVTATEPPGRTVKRGRGSPRCWRRRPAGRAADRLRAPEVRPAPAPPHDAGGHPGERRDRGGRASPALRQRARSPTPRRGRSGSRPGSVARHWPTLAATPLPPRKPFHTGKQWPTTAAVPADVGAVSPGQPAAGGAGHGALGDVGGQDAVAPPLAQHGHRVGRAGVARCRPGAGRWRPRWRGGRRRRPTGWCRAGSRVVGGGDQRGARLTVRRRGRSRHRDAITRRAGRRAARPHAGRWRGDDGRAVPAGARPGVERPHVGRRRRGGCASSGTRWRPSTCGATAAATSPTTATTSPPWPTTCSACSTHLGLATAGGRRPVHRAATSRSSSRPARPTGSRAWSASTAARSSSGAAGRDWEDCDRGARPAPLDGHAAGARRAAAMRAAHPDWARSGHRGHPRQLRGARRRHRAPVAHPRAPPAHPAGAVGAPPVGRHPEAATSRVLLVPADSGDAWSHGEARRGRPGRGVRRDVRVHWFSPARPRRPRPAPADLSVRRTTEPARGSGPPTGARS